MTIAEKLTAIAENVPNVYDAGKKAEYDAFWDGFQDKGTRTQYPYAFYVWGADYFKPKYPIIFGTNVSSQDTFSYSAITDVPVDIIFQEDFRFNSAFYWCTALHTIKKIIINESNAIDYYTFDGCRSLVNIRFEGTIGDSINFASCPLSKESIESVFAALSSTASGKTLTLNKTAKEKAFTDSEWAELIATKSNWTFSLV